MVAYTFVSVNRRNSKALTHITLRAMQQTDRQRERETAVDCALYVYREGVCVCVCVCVCVTVWMTYCHVSVLSCELSTSP